MPKQDESYVPVSCKHVCLLCYGNPLPRRGEVATAGHTGPRGREGHGRRKLGGAREGRTGRSRRGRFERSGTAGGTAVLGGAYGSTQAGMMRRGWSRPVSQEPTATGREALFERGGRAAARDGGRRRARMRTELAGRRGERARPPERKTRPRCVGGRSATGGERLDGGCQGWTHRGAARTLRLTKGRAGRHRPAAQAKGKIAVRARAALLSDRRLPRPKAVEAAGATTENAKPQCG